MEESIAFGMELEWLLLTLACGLVALIVGYRLGYRQRRAEEAEAFEKSRAGRVGQGKGTDGTHGTYEEQIREERLRVRTERQELREKELRTLREIAAGGRA